MKIPTSNGIPKCVALGFIMNRWIGTGQMSFLYCFTTILEEAKDENVLRSSHIQFQISSFIYGISTTNELL